jgi:hypothetical protein
MVSFRWTPTMIAVVVPTVIAGVIGLLLCAIVILGLLALGLKPVSSL